jgi:hypothetical protein
LAAVDGFRQDTGTGSFTHTSWTAEQEGMRQLLLPDGIFQGGSNVCLTYNRRKILWPVFAGGNDEILHIRVAIYGLEKVSCSIEGRDLYTKSTIKAAYFIP